MSFCLFFLINVNNFFPSLYNSGSRDFLEVAYSYHKNFQNGEFNQNGNQFMVCQEIGHILLSVTYMLGLPVGMGTRS